MPRVRARRQNVAYRYLAGLLLLALLLGTLAACGGPGPRQRGDELRLLESGMSRTEWKAYREAHPQE
jgi:hypothetical protein